MGMHMTGTDLIYKVQPDFASLGLDTTAFSEDLGALDAPRYMVAGSMCQAVASDSFAAYTFKSFVDRNLLT